jgi:hypothetical protein
MPREARVSLATTIPRTNPSTHPHNHVHVNTPAVFPGAFESYVAQEHLETQRTEAEAGDDGCNPERGRVQAQVMPRVDDVRCPLQPVVHERTR